MADVTEFLNNIWPHNSTTWQVLPAPAINLQWEPLMSNELQDDEENALGKFHAKNKQLKHYNIINFP